MKKIIKKPILCILIIAIILIASFVLYSKSTYTLDKVSKMLSSAEFPSNIHIESTTSSESYNLFIDIYQTEGMKFTSRKEEFDSNINVDSLEISDTTKLISINNLDKTIIINNTNANFYLETPYTYSFFSSIDQNESNAVRGIYKYCGKENVNDKKCIKVSITANYDDRIDVQYFYIDLETNLIVKEEFYSGTDKNNLEKTSTQTYEYEFDGVTDESVLKFDLNNYSDYTYIE